MDKDDFDTSLYVLSNKDRTFGVSVLLYDNTDILKDCLNKVKDETGNNCEGLYVLPSSIHELILVPDNGDMNKNYMMQMVREVNSTEVRPDEI